ncbi:unnamed protein product [Gongylonema pulchrum]|uniref:DNA mismatch repair proteins mutS family domain-containing protein n=1 Tax=Gongylonema pulchrum TaxID=637853 RepID=A0A3P7NH40_9BILA|nr:unnamed protein product [Gongylonema pulchrum]
MLIPCLYHAIEAISIVDFILALATYATKTPSVRPSFAQSMSMIVKQGRHPLLDNATGLAVPNDVAGKSTYLKQVCLLQVLAQTGSFVPAEMAAFPILKRIFSRIGHNDDAVSKKSTFALEMSELVPILKSADASSLVVIDELAPNTAYEEGLSLCYAVCEELLKKKVCRISRHLGILHSVIGLCHIRYSFSDAGVDGGIVSCN